MPPPTRTRRRSPHRPPPVWDGLAGAPDTARGTAREAGRGVDGALLDVQTDALTAAGSLGAAVGAAVAPPTLTNPRFAGDRTLRRILDGEVDALSSSHDGRRGAVAKVQQALVALGFELPLHGADGRYGSETEEAIRQFRARHAPPASTTLDAAALRVLDRVAPPPGEQVEHTVDYDRLLADGRLDITVGVGHSDSRTLVEDAESGEYEETERTFEEAAAERFRSWLADNGFRLELFGLSGEEFYRTAHEFTWTGGDGTVRTRTVDVWVRLVVAGPGAAAAFRRGLSSDEIAIYKGHARYGSGPDFDAKASAVENFRIGIDRALEEAGRRTRVQEARRHGVAVDEENDLVEMTSSGEFDEDRYRVWFFNACTSMAYLDEIREHAGGTDTVDVVGSRTPTSFSVLDSEAELTRVQRFLEGILDAESIESVVAGLDELERELREAHGGTAPAGGTYTSSGFGDNPTVP